MHYLDNESAKYGLMSGWSHSAASCALIHECWLQDAAGASSPWYTRVPSGCNVADGPSRLDLQEVQRRGARAAALRGPEGEERVWEVLVQKLTNGQV